MNETDRLKVSFLDFVSGIVLFILGILIFVYGIYILKTARFGSGVEWYASPALLPMFIGIVIGILSVLLILKKKKYALEFLRSRENNNACNDRISLKELIINYKSNTYLRLILTLLLLIIYVFILIGRIPFLMATFIYLVSNMILFREDNFAIWKIVLISLITSAAIYFGFGILAKIPLP